MDLSVSPSRTKKQLPTAIIVQALALVGFYRGARVIQKREVPPALIHRRLTSLRAFASSIHLRSTVESWVSFVLSFLPSGSMRMSSPFR